MEPLPGNWSICVASVFEDAVDQLSILGSIVPRNGGHFSVFSIFCLFSNMLNNHLSVNLTKFLASWRSVTVVLEIQHEVELTDAPIPAIFGKMPVN